jgi:hypothetical protein
MVAMDIEKPWSQYAAFGREESSFSEAVVGNGDLCFRPSPRVLLIEPSHHGPIRPIGLSESGF